MLERFFLSRQDFLPDIPGIDHETDQTQKNVAYLITKFDAFYFICCGRICRVVENVRLYVQSIVFANTVPTLLKGTDTSMLSSNMLD